MIKTILLAALGGTVAVGFGLASRSPTSSTECRTAESPRAVIAASGITEGAREELVLRPEIQGTIRTIHVRTNQEVRQGDLLVELDGAVHQAQVQRGEALVQSRQADYERARDVGERARRSGPGTSIQDLRAAEANVLKARADWEVARADLALAQAERAKTRLHAPWDGRVLRIYDEPGALVGPASARPILLLADVSRRRVRAFIEELDALRVREGQQVVVTMDGLPGKEFRGRVSAQILLRMDSPAPRSDAPGEYTDIYHRPVLIDLDGAPELPLNLRVQVRIDAGPAAADQRP